MFYAGYAEMWRVVQDMALRMPEVDAIAGVPVSGLAPAGMLSAATGIKCVPLEAVPGEVRRLLVLEDASGFAKFRQQRAGQAWGREVLYGAVYACDAATDLDLVGCLAPKPRLFSWNLFKSDKCGRVAYDLDGVLCENPTAEQIDYGPRYAAFLEITRRRRHVRSKLGWIVTGRMERYRAATVAWLDRAGIRYGELDMAPDDQQHSVEAHAKRKADWLAAHPECLLFVESHPRQAARIAELTGRAVVCAETEQAWNTDTAQAVKAKRSPRIIYTVSTGAYEAHAPFAYRPPPGWDYRVLTSADCPAYLSAKQQAAWAKIHGPRVFAEYEASLCIDDDMTVLTDPLPVLRGPVTFLRRDENPSWRTDLDCVISIRKAATPEAVATETQRLAACGLKDGPCYMSGIIYREHVIDVVRLCDEWWYWYGQSETQRDQPSLAMAVQRCGIEPHTVTEKAMSAIIRHNTRKADIDGVRVRVTDKSAEPEHHRPRRRGDRP
jgi:uncharacterized HAD superfamily protein